MLMVTGDTARGGEINLHKASSSPVVKIGDVVSIISPRSESELLGWAKCLSGGIISYQWDFDGNGTYDSLY